LADELIVAIALILVIEGALYALFPTGMKWMAQQLQQIPAGSLRAAGLVAATAGVGIVWLMKRS
jgi:uncharacterized protein YjeT (DUF2065 family)